MLESQAGFEYRGGFSLVNLQCLHHTGMEDYPILVYFPNNFLFK